LNDIEIKQILSQQFSLRHVRVTRVQPGWSALAFRVQSGNALYFLKAYDKTRFTSHVWIKGISRYMPTVVWLGQHTSLRDRIPHVIPAADGDYKYEDAKWVYILFDWIEGETPCDKPLTRPQMAALAQIVAELHGFNRPIPTAASVMSETYAVPFFDGLMTRACHADGNIPGEYLNIIIKRLHQLSEASRIMPSLNLPLVVCHNDIHGWNVITQGDKLLLLDWEGLRFAPREADLFMFKYERYWGQRWDEFYHVYKRQHTGLDINETAMRFFQLRRRLDDVNEFINNIVLDNADDAVKAEAREALVRECGLLKTDCIASAL